MSGLGGGGAMVLYRAREDRYEVIDYGMRAPDSLRPGGLSADRRWRGLRHLPLAAGQGRSQPPWSRLDRGARRGRRHGRGASPPRQNAVAGIAWPERQARRRRSAGGLVDHADDCEFGRRPAALSRQRRPPILQDGLPPNRAMGHQVQRAPAAGPAQGDDVASRRPKVRAISTRAIWRAAWRPTFRPPAAHCRSTTSPPSAPMAARRWPFPIAAATSTRRRN